MDFAFSQEQEMLRSSAREFLRARYPADRVAGIADGGGFDRSEWSAIADMGWTGISVPEDEGGAGLGFLEEIVLSEELGRSLYPGPFFSSVVLALPLIRAVRATDLVTEMVRGSTVVTLAWAGPDGTFDSDVPPKAEWNDERLTAERLFVPDLAVSDVAIVIGAFADGVGVWTVPQGVDGARRRTHPTVDSTRPMGELILHNVPAPLAGVIASEQLAAVRDRALAALAAEAVGVGSAALDMAVAHVKEREQFGRPVGTFQAVSHQLAQTFIELETARSLAYWAGWAVSEGAPEAPAAAAASKARASEAAVAACERAIQVHGGIGFTWEHALHRWYKRALGISAFMGWPSEHRARVATAILD
ncbi:MAG: acyl-CoA dehydrogenase family protein [Actinomycetota bacterium]